MAPKLHQTDKKDSQEVKNSVVYQTLQKIAAFCNIDAELKEFPATERLSWRQEKIKLLVREFFEWAKRQAVDCAVPPKSKTGRSLKSINNQESYLKVFSTDGDIPTEIRKIRIM